MRGLAHESIHGTIGADVVVAGVTKRLDRRLRRSGGEVDALLDVAHASAGQRIAVVRRESSGEEVVAVLGQPGVPVADVIVRVVSGSRHWRNFGLRIDGSTIGVSHAVYDEMHVSGRGVCDLETGVWRIQRSDHLAHAGLLDVANPQGNTTGNLLIGAIDVDDTGLATGDPGDLVDLAGVEARLGDLAGLKIDEVHARARASVLLEGILGVREQSDRAIGTGVSDATSDGAEKPSVYLSVVAQAMECNDKHTQA